MQFVYLRNQPILDRVPNFREPVSSNFGGNFDGFKYFGKPYLDASFTGTVALKDPFSIVGVHLYNEETIQNRPVLTHEVVDIHESAQGEGIAKRLIHLFNNCFDLESAVLAHGDYSTEGEFCLQPLFLEHFDCDNYAVVDNDYYLELEAAGSSFPETGYYDKHGTLLDASSRHAFATKLRNKRKYVLDTKK
jgi:hypothetical protein